jgi:hypothetical protein
LRASASDLGLLRVSIAIVWIATAVVSAGIYPVEESLALLARVGLTGTAALIALYGAAALDLALGIAAMAVRRRWIWTLQLVVVLGYTAIITACLPEQWLHPYGPLVKNLPILAAMLLLRRAERA